LQKLSDFFINEKLPPRARGRWPLLCAGEKIIWVPGFRPQSLLNYNNHPEGSFTFRSFAA